MDEPKVNHDPARWRRMQEPFETHEEMVSNAEKFLAAVDKAREEFRIAEVETIIVAKCILSNGEEGEAMVRQHLGDPLRAEGMAAYAYGNLKREREQLFAKILAGEPSTKARR